jgi:hypothetical protein
MKILHTTTQDTLRVPSSDVALEKCCLKQYPHGSFQDAVSGDLIARAKKIDNSSSVIRMHQPELDTNSSILSGLTLNTFEDIDAVKKAITDEAKGDWEFMENLKSVVIDDNGKYYAVLEIPSEKLRDEDDRKEIMAILKRLANNPAVISRIEKRTGFEVGLTAFIISNEQKNLPDGMEKENPIGLTYETLGPEKGIKFNPTLTGASGGNSITPEKLNESFQYDLPSMQNALMSEIRLAYIDGMPIYVFTKTKDLPDVNSEAYTQMTNNLNGSLIVSGGHFPTRDQIIEEFNDGHLTPVKTGDKLSTKLLDTTSPSLTKEAQNYIGTMVTRGRESHIEFIDQREFDTDPNFEAIRDANNQVLDFIHPNRVREKNGSERERIV